MSAGSSGFWSRSSTTTCPAKFGRCSTWRAARCCTAGFFYPLYTLGTEQLYRVADAATWHRCRQLGKPLPNAGPERETFAARVAWLLDQGAIVSPWWWGHAPANPDGGVRMARNVTSHATFQQLDMPGSALAELHHVTEQVNELFSSARPASEE